MEESKWIKQISKDNSIQLLLCEHFIHPTINDCVLVGNSSFRLLILQSNQIKEVARYDHPLPIISACISYNAEQPEIAFISGQKLYFMIPYIDHFEITNSITLNYKYSFIVSNFKYICLYPRESSITLYDRSTNRFFDHLLANDTKIWSCSFSNDYLVTLEYQNIFKVKMYKITDLDNILNTASFVVNYFLPYKLVSIPSHSSVYLLCESVLIQFKITKNQSLSDGWSINKFPIGIKNSDPLIVDACPCGVRLFILTAGSIVLRFDGSKFEFVGEYPGATCMAPMSISRFLLVFDSCRVKLYDGNMSFLDEISRAACFYSSYTLGNFTSATQFSVHSIFYDYGIEVEKSAAIEFKNQPLIFVFKDCFFLLFNDKTIVIDADFKDVTPSTIKKRSFDRIHANNKNSFFAMTSTHILAYEYGSFSEVGEVNDLSDHRFNQIITVNGQNITLYTHRHSTLLKEGSTKFESCVSSLNFGDIILVALFNNKIIVLDTELNVMKSVVVGFVSFSIVNDGCRLFFGTGIGQIAYSDKDFENVEFFESTIGISTVNLMYNADELTAKCDGKLFHITDNRPKELPHDFLFFSGFESRGTFLGLLKKEKHGEFGHIITAHFADRTHGFRSKVLFEFNQPVTKLCGAKRGGDFVCCIGNKALFWSRGSVKFDLEEDEEVHSINEWNAFYSTKHKSKIIQFWIVCTKFHKADSRLIIFNQSQSTNKVEMLLKKQFDSPITAFAVSSQKLAFFVSNDIITGISLETGSLKPKAKCPAKIKDVVAIDSNEKFVAALADKNEFALFSIVNDMEIKIVAAGRKLGIFGRIKIIGDFIAVSSRVQPTLYIYKMETQNGEIEKELRLIRDINFLSPVSSIFGVNGNALCTCVCGEVFLVCCNKDGELTDYDVSKVFSFSQSALSVS